MVFLSAKGHDRDENAEASTSGQSPVLALRDRKSESCYWYLVPHKGGDFETYPNLLRLMSDDLKSLGYKRVCFRSDGENPIKRVLTDLTSWYNGEVVPENTAEGDSASNGNAEGGIFIMKGHVRTVKLDL